MSGVFGLDLQQTRTMIGLVEGSDNADKAAVGRPIGDGRRQLIPNACGPEPLWGSRSAEASLREIGPGRVDLVDGILNWCDPLGSPFLQGVHNRLFAYLGNTSPTNRNGYHLCLAVSPVSASRSAPDREILSERCARAGLTSISTVRPTDALIYRWLAEPGSAFPFAGTVIAVACGEAWTAITTYRIDRSENGHWIDAGTTGWCESGSRPACAQLARLVLDRCREGIEAISLLAVLDGVFEFGAMLQIQSLDRDVEWNGPLADRMFSPLRLTRSGMARWPEVSSTTDAVRALVGSALTRADKKPPLILVGGIGAVWPFVADALRGTGAVWQSRDPANDISIGAAWSPRLRLRFIGGLTNQTTETQQPVVPVPSATQAGDELMAGIGGCEIDPIEIPPWLRDE